MMNFVNVHSAMDTQAGEPVAFDETNVVRGLEERRQLGAFYTPQRLSGMLSDWAIRRASDLVLEPSFGGCGFLASALSTLARKGAAEPAKRVFGCDIDSLAFTHLSKLFDGHRDLDGFVQGDFLDCFEVDSWPSKFTAVIGNPPYIPHQRIGKERVRELSSRVWPGTGVGGRSSLWAYFIWHSLRFIQVGGRMAWVLPGAFMQADYAKALRDYLPRRFERVAAFVVRDRLFISEGTDEETVVLLADGFRESEADGRMAVGIAADLEELEKTIARWTEGLWTGDLSGPSAAILSLTSAETSLFSAVAAHESVLMFGKLAKVQIGVVTGANHFFVLSRSDLEAAGIPESACIKVLSKFKASASIALVDEDFQSYAAEGGKTFLISLGKEDQSAPIERYLSTFDTKRREDNSTFRKRAHWSETYDGRRPDAFFPVMHHDGPRLVLNETNGTSTNTIHRVFFHAAAASARTRKLAAVSILTSFSQMSAEIVGRRYGSGVLKHEPRDAERLQLLMPKVGTAELNSVFKELDQLLRRGSRVEAAMRADTFIYEAAGLTSAKKISSDLIQALAVVRQRRRP
ncbi:hypothetical protein J2Y63_005577 [Shinella sp. BE166]